MNESPAPATRHVAAALRCLPLAAAVLGLLSFLTLAALRMTYPFELEWMEGGISDAVWRVVHGKPLYASPALDYVAFIYPPFYFYVSAAVSGVVHGDFLPLRLVSSLSALGSCVLIYALVTRETAQRSAGLLAAGLFAATYGVSDTWFDLARVDSLFLLLLLASFYVARARPSRGGQARAGVLLALAFLTKQVALGMALPVAAVLLATRRRAGLWYPASALGLCAGISWLLDRVYGGWYRYFLFTVPARHSVYFDRAATVWSDDLWPVLPIAMLLGAGYFVAALRAVVRKGSDTRAFHACVALGMIAGAAVTRLHFGSARNVMVPAYAAIAIVAGLAAGAAWHWCSRREPRTRIACEALLAVLLVAQFALLRYDPRTRLPTAADRAAGEHIVRQLASVPGDALIPFHGQLARMAGKPPHAHQMAIQDIYRGGWATWKVVDDQIEAALIARRFTSVLLDSPGWRRATLEQSYELAGPLAGPNAKDAFWPVSGMRTRPSLRYRPRLDTAR